MESKKEVIKFFIDKGILPSPEFVKKLDNASFVTRLREQISSQNHQDLLLMAQPIPQPASSAVTVVESYAKASKKHDVQDFVAHFTNRYTQLKRILAQRPELQNLTSINKILARKEKEAVSFIALIRETEVNKKGNIMLTVEDPTGEIKVFVSKNNLETFRLAKSLVHDQVIGITGSNGQNIVFSRALFLPEAPLIRSKKTCPDEVYALFLSDLHVGSSLFLKEEFNRFLDWVNGNVGSEAQKAISRKVKYIFVSGDLVDGVGIFPGQEEELAIPDITLQYEECTRLLSRIPPHIKLIICPGNHDAIRLAEPQPLFYKDFAGSLWSLPNTTFISNPGRVTIHATPTFPGFDVLLYHGYSFDYYVANVEKVRNAGGYNRCDEIMKYLLQSRHLAPAHRSNLYIPDTESDPLVISNVPDIFCSGHIHKTHVGSYRGTTLICASAWQAKTPYQEKLGHTPEPCRAPLVNLKTREVKILKFIQDGT